MTAVSTIANRDYYLIIDKSGTMAKKDISLSGRMVSRWMACKESLIALTEKICDLDPDGITIYTFASKFRKYEGVLTSAKIDTIWMENDPSGTTNLAPVLKDALADYFKKARAPQGAAPAVPPKAGATILIITDGEPDNRDEVITEIFQAAKFAKDDSEIAINFMQVGTDPEATGFLTFLDTGLKTLGCTRDIVATIKMDQIEDVGLSAVLQGTVFHSNQ